MLGGLSLGLGACKTSANMVAAKGKKIISLSFDDGFKKSFYQIAEIYERYGLSACFNVIASGHLPTFQQVDNWILPKLLGNFDDWNALHERGHEIMPHSWKHLNLAMQPVEKSKDLIDQCLDYFEENLEGFKSEEAVFNFPFNASTSELETYLLSKVRAIRAWGDSSIHPLVKTKNPISLGCTTMGSGNVDQWVDEKIANFLRSSEGWLILNLHGLNGEGWGPISPKYLDKLLSKLVEINEVEIKPTGMVLKDAF